MADRSIPALARAHLVNPTVRMVLRSRAHRLLSGNLLLLDYTGRRTGHRFVLPVGYAPGVGCGLIVAAGQQARKTWWRNFDDQPRQVTIQLGGHPTQASARLAKVGTDEHTQALHLYNDRFPRATVPSAVPLLILTPNHLTGPAGRGRRSGCGPGCRRCGPGPWSMTTTRSARA